MRMFIGGEWLDKDEKVPVINPFDGAQIDTVPKGDTSDVDAAITSAQARTARTDRCGVMLEV